MTLEELDNTIFCEINDEERRIEVPPIYRVLGVESDEKVNRLWFKCPRIVGDNVDLSTLNLFVNYENANSEKNIYLITDVEVVGDYIVFSWLLSRHVTEYKGNVRYIICAKKSINGDTTNEWNTRPASGVVNEGLEAIHETEEQNSDVIEEILSRLSVLDGASQLSTPDWNENDPNSSDFIKNRTHWFDKEYNYTNKVIRWNHDYDPNLEQRWQSIDSNTGSPLIDLEYERDYRLTISDTEYVVEDSCKRYNNSDDVSFYYIGNISLYDNTQEDNGFPILIALTDDSMPRNIIITIESLVGSDMTIMFGVLETVYHKLPSEYIPEPSNKITLDKIACPMDYNPGTDHFGQPVAYPISDHYLQYDGDSLRFTKDGGVVKGVNEITKDGKNFLRLMLEWSPEIQNGENNNKPGFVDIPVESITDIPQISNQSSGVEIVFTEPEQQVNSDWNENDSAEKSFVKNRTHWHEHEETIVTPEDKTGLDVSQVDISFYFNLPENTIIAYWYRIGDTISSEFIPDCLFTFRFTNEEVYFRHERIIDYVTGDDNRSLVETENGEMVIFSNLPVIFNVVNDGSSFSHYGISALFERAGLYAVYVDQRLGGLPIEEVTDFTIPESYHPLDVGYMPNDVKDAVKKKHTHENQAVLDSVTTQTLTDITSNTSARHTHNNKSTLDTITTQNVTDINNLHANASLLRALQLKGFASTGTKTILCYGTAPVNGVIKATISGNGYEGVLKAGAVFYFSDVQTGDNDNTITITGFENNAEYPYPEYSMDFTTGSTAPTLTTPIAGVTWVDEPVLEANKHYQFSIQNGVGLWCAVDVEAVSE